MSLGLDKFSMGIELVNSIAVDILKNIFGCELNVFMIEACSDFFKIQCNIIDPPTLGLLNCLIYSGFPTKSVLLYLIFCKCATCPASLFHRPYRCIFGEENKKSWAA